MECEPSHTSRRYRTVWTLDGPALPTRASFARPRAVPYTRTSTRADRAERYVLQAYLRQLIARSARLRRQSSDS